MSLYHEAAEILSAPSGEGGSLKSRVFRKKNLKSTPNQLYALVFETCKWSALLKEVVENSELLKHERKACSTRMCLLQAEMLTAPTAYAGTVTTPGS